MAGAEDRLYSANEEGGEIPSGWDDEARELLSQLSAEQASVYLRYLRRQLGLTRHRSQQTA